MTKDLHPCFLRAFMACTFQEGGCSLQKFLLLKGGDHSILTLFVCSLYRLSRCFVCWLLVKLMLLLFKNIFWTSAYSRNCWRNAQEIYKEINILFDLFNCISLNSAITSTSVPSTKCTCHFNITPMISNWL